MPYDKNVERTVDVQRRDMEAKQAKLDRLVDQGKDGCWPVLLAIFSFVLLVGVRVLT